MSDNRDSDIRPPPWYRAPPGVTKGPKRTQIFIIFGILIDNEDGRAWFKETYDFELPSDHRQDLSVTIQLDDLVKEKDMAFECSPATRRLDLFLDVLVITQIERGPFTHDGPQAYDEVLQEDRAQAYSRSERGKSKGLARE